MCWTVPPPHCHCWEEMGFLPMLAPERGTPLTVCPSVSSSGHAALNMDL